MFNLALNTRTLKENFLYNFVKLSKMKPTYLYVGATSDYCRIWSRYSISLSQNNYCKTYAVLITEYTFIKTIRHPLELINIHHSEFDTTKGNWAFSEYWGVYLNIYSQNKYFATTPPVHIQFTHRLSTKATHLNTVYKYNVKYGYNIISL